VTRVVTHLRAQSPLYEMAQSRLRLNK